MKDQEIYTIFNTQKLLNKKPGVTIGKTSGLAGIAYWINEHFDLPEERQVTKQDKIVIELKKWIDDLYESDRTTNISNREMRQQIIEFKKNMKNAQAIKVTEPPHERSKRSIEKEFGK